MPGIIPRPTGFPLRGPRNARRARRPNRTPSRALLAMRQALSMVPLPARTKRESHALGGQSCDVRARSPDRKSGDGPTRTTTRKTNTDKPEQFWILKPLWGFAPGGVKMRGHLRQAGLTGALPLVLLCALALLLALAPRADAAMVLKNPPRQSIQTVPPPARSSTAAASSTQRRPRPNPSPSPIST